MKFNYRVILFIIGLLLIFNGLFMLLAAAVSIYYWEVEWVNMLLAAGINIGVGGLLWLTNRNNENKELKRREGYLIVSGGWIIMSLFGALPFVLSGAIPNMTDAVFETISGYSTTGASILTDIEAQSKGILFWRSMTQWIGGMGIIVLAVAILPILGIGGMQLFVAEAPGISPDKLKPRIKETAKRLWYVYIGLTLIETVLLMLGDMSFFDAINHSLTTMATGGFSTKNASIAAYNSSYIECVIIIFMFLAGMSFTLSYFGFKAKFAKIWENEEFRIYLYITLFSASVVTLGLLLTEDIGVAKSVRDALFQVVSIITTTGFATADYTIWTPFLTLFFFMLLFVGGMAGSTAGGVKIVRHTILFKNSILEIKRQLHPSAIIPVRLNKKAIPRDITYNILAFLMIYLTIFAIGTMLLTMTGMDFDTSLGAAATSLGNVGPGIGDLGPANNFSALPDTAKWILGFLMLLGRLELFTVLILLSPYYWRAY